MNDIDEAMREALNSPDETVSRHALARLRLSRGEPADEQRMPPIRKQVSNLFHSGVSLIKSGFALASEDEQRERIQICKACPKYDGNGRCFECGCQLGIKLKLAGEVCPDTPPRWGVGKRKAIGEAIDPSTFITAEQLTRDTLTLNAHLPADVDQVVAIARSGLLPGSLISYMRHLPLATVSRQCEVMHPGHGRRLDGREEARLDRWEESKPRHVLLVDDTVASGAEMTACLPIVREAFPGARITRAVVYAHPNGQHAVDTFVSLYPGSHYLEWNWCNAGHGMGCAYDFDGILCHDCPVDDDDDGPRYARFLASARPLYLPRRSLIPAIITARHEKYRAETLAWLEKFGVKVGHLVMRTFPLDPAKSFTEQIAAYKAFHYERSGEPLFAESDPGQAEAIARISGKPVLCPEAGRVFNG